MTNDKKNTSHADDTKASEWDEDFLEAIRSMDYIEDDELMRIIKESRRSKPEDAINFESSIFSFQSITISWE